jgi:hypothetical protein
MRLIAIADQNQLHKRGKVKMGDDDLSIYSICNMLNGVSIVNLKVPKSNKNTRRIT